MITCIYLQYLQFSRMLT